MDADQNTKYPKHTGIQADQMTTTFIKIGIFILLVIISLFA
jgi:hypothetical protein